VNNLIKYAAIAGIFLGALMATLSLTQDQANKAMAWACSAAWAFTAYQSRRQIDHLQKR